MCAACAAAAAAAHAAFFLVERPNKEQLLQHKNYCQSNRVQILVIISKFIFGNLIVLLPGADSVSQTSPYAVPSTSSSNTYSSPNYGQTEQFNSQYSSPPAYSNSAHTIEDKDTSVTDRKF